MNSPNIPVLYHSRSRSFWKQVNLSLVCLLLPAFAGATGPLSATAFGTTAVRLQPGPFADAVEVNRVYLLALDPERLLAPFLREAGLELKQPSYGNWESGGLDGHTGGHYLSALALMVAADGDSPDGELRRRLDYVIDELERCQQAGGNGYIGGVPRGQELWKEIAAGKISAHGFGLNDRWVPLYNIHKTFAGLRDTWLSLDHEKARCLLIGMGDWWVELIGHLNDDQLQDMLRSEHGGMNEVMADLYAITGNESYLRAAKRSHHRAVLDPLMQGEDRLTGQHANTQIPKVIGLARIASLTRDADALRGARFFWETVIQHRSVPFGGNSVREHFHEPGDFEALIHDRQGPETCNTYNMLRLTERLFAMEPQARYADYYERALYNHILASIHPEIPGYVYFTPMRPAHYRVYSQPEQCFWCCVGSGMENPGKYGNFIYSRAADGGVYVNLFIASTLKASENLTLRQGTNFPSEPRSTLELSLREPENFSLSLRHPWWVKPGALVIRINGEVQPLDSLPSSYVELKRTWKDGDRIELELPMHLTVDPIPDGSNWVSLLYGPLVLAAPAGTDQVTGLRADDSRMGHVAHGPLVPLDAVEVLRTRADDLSPFFQSDPSGDPMAFRLTEVVHPERPEGLLLKPFFTVHDQRYQIVWQRFSPEDLATRDDQLATAERQRALREAATIDRIAVGEQQSEVEHDFRGIETETGIFTGKRWRHGSEFSYTLSPRGERHLELELILWGGDQGRIFDIVIDGVVIATQALPESQTEAFFRVRYPVPEKLLSANAEARVTVQFIARQGLAGGIYEVRLMRAGEGIEP